ncbi:DUF3558 family protein [Demequina mangrovi]|uniref:DUF3558 domain-containing protein n=1 Tax=Demequina mangrovi TaxID=1043493 RepID=A0A1H7ATE7_9MICO|nr:DUF3558 family protein [Demequina mangrovi]SEJ67894.1 Protein of unknown function [Demequina mangrovi]
MTPRQLLTSAAATASGVALLSGCTPLGSSGDPSASATPTALSTASPVAHAPAGTVDPCALVKRGNVSNAVGANLAQGVFNSALSTDGRNICDWRPENEDKTEPRVQVEINWAFPDASSHRALAEEVFGKTLDVSREVEGATDLYMTPSRHTLGMSVGDYFVKVSMIDPDASRSEGADAIIDIGRRVAANLSS